MSITKVDSHLYRGPKASTDTSSYSLFNPAQRPGGFVCGVASVVQGGLGSRVACKLALEHFVEGVSDYYQSDLDQSSDINEQVDGSLNATVLEQAFREANTSVYDFSHKISSGGQLSASMLGVVAQDDYISVGKVGVGSAYLVRDGELYPFFEEADDAQAHIGANASASLQISTIPVEGDDLFVIISETLKPFEEVMLGEIASMYDDIKESPASYFAKKLFPTLKDLPLLMLARFGPQAVFLKKAVNG